MKKMEFMREAANVLMAFFSELYVEKECPLQTISLKTQQGSFKLRNSGTLAFYLYKTGSISYNTASVFKERTEYHSYYVFDERDDHREVLKKFAQDLRTLKEYFEDIFMYASDADDPFAHTVFEYWKPFSSTLCKKGEFSEEDEEDGLDHGLSQN